MCGGAREARAPCSGPLGVDLLSSCQPQASRLTHTALLLLLLLLLLLRTQ
jgi:hypothetical protein